MLPIKFTATIAPDGTLKLERLTPGQLVEVVIREAVTDPTEGGKYPLRGTPYIYIDPFEPACDPDDWEVNR